MTVASALSSYGLVNRIKDRYALNVQACLAGCNPADHIRAVLFHLQGVERSLLAGNTLTDDL